MIFAGGEGRRLGGVSKALIEVGGRPLWQRAFEELRGISEDILVVSPIAPDWAEGINRLTWLNDHTINGEPLGPAGALSAALTYAQNEYGDEAVITTVPVDAPFYRSSLSDGLVCVLRESGRECAIAWTDDRPQPTFGVWCSSLAGRVREDINQGDRALHKIASRQGAARVDFDADDRRFFNINTPADLDAAIALEP